MSGAEPLAGTGRLARTMLRRDRVRIPVWAASVAGLVGYAALAVPAAYPDPAALQTRAEVMRQPAGAVMAGPGYGLDDYTVERMVANELLGMCAVAVAVMSLLLAVRHTRGDEEAGRTELVLAGPVGRRAPLTAALLVLAVADLAVGATVAAALVGSGFAVPDSLACGAGLAAAGLAFGGIGAAAAQASGRARAAAGLAGAAVGLAFVLRAVGDARAPGGSALSWWSPIGWVQQMRPYVDLRWWPLLLALALAAAAVAAAYALAARRDLGAGLLPERGGRTRATAASRTLPGLAARLERGRLLWWAAGLFAFASLTGSLAGPITEAFEQRPELLSVLGAGGGGDLVRQAMGAFLRYFALAVAVYAALAARPLRADEEAGRAELALAGGVRRAWWLLVPLLVSVAGSAALLAVSGLGLGAGAAAELGAGAAGEFALAGLAYLPLVACWAAASVLLYAVRAGSAPLWAALAVVAVVGLYGPLLNLPGPVLDAEPFGAVDALPGRAPAAGPLWAAAGAAVALTAAATAAFRRRDVQA